MLKLKWLCHSFECSKYIEYVALLYPRMRSNFDCFTHREYECVMIVCVYGVLCECGIIINADVYHRSLKPSLNLKITLTKWITVSQLWMCLVNPSDFSATAGDYLHVIVITSKVEYMKTFQSLTSLFRRIYEFLWIMMRKLSARILLEKC